MFETAVDIWLLLISSNCFAMHFAFCMVTYWFRIKFQRNVQANQINFGNVNTWSRQNSAPSCAICSPCYVQINIQIFCEISYLMYGYDFIFNLFSDLIKTN